MTRSQDDKEHERMKEREKIRRELELKREKLMQEL